MRRVNPQQTIEKGIEQGAKNIIPFCRLSCQLYSAIELGSEYGMHMMERRLNKLLQQNLIRWDDALVTASVVEYIRQPGEGSLT